MYESKPSQPEGGKVPETPIATEPDDAIDVSVYRWLFPSPAEEEQQTTEGQEPSPIPQAQMPAELSQPLFFDLETVPDYSRMLDYPVQCPEALPRNEVQTEPGALMSMAVSRLTSTLLAARPTDEYLDMLLDYEQSTGKARSSAIEAIQSVRRKLAAQDNAKPEYSKVLSTTPEYCKIVALGWAVGAGDIHSIVVGTDGDTEADLIRQFWSLAQVHSPVVGWNCNGFDIPVMAVRTALLNIRAGFVLDTSPWAGKVVDCFERRFRGRMPATSAPGKMKDMAKCCGIAVPAGDIDGSQVEELYETDRDRIHLYVQSDVRVLRDYFMMFRGVLF
jgi:hypothetical protein